MHCTFTIPKLFIGTALCVVHGYCVSDHCICGGQGVCSIREMETTDVFWGQEGVCSEE